MVDPPPETDARHHPGGDTRTPLWVKVFGIIALVLVLAFVVVLLTQGPHRPGMPMHGAGGGNAPSSSVTALAADGGHTPSDRGH